MSARTPGGTFIGILDSQTAQDDIINRFDLRRVYHCKFYIDARKILTERTTIVEDKKSGIISISVTDRDPNRARDIAKAYVEELDKLVNTVEHLLGPSRTDFPGGKAEIHQEMIWMPVLLN